MRLGSAAGWLTGFFLLLSANAYGETGDKAVIEKGKTVKNSIRSRELSIHQRVIKKIHLP